MTTLRELRLQNGVITKRKKRAKQNAKRVMEIRYDQIQGMKRALKKMEEQYEKLLDTDVQEFIDDPSLRHEAEHGNPKDMTMCEIPSRAANEGNLLVYQNNDSEAIVAEIVDDEED